MKHSAIIDLFNQEESIAEQIRPKTKSYEENTRLKAYFEEKLNGPMSILWTKKVERSCHFF